MNLISREELKELLDVGADIKLVMALGEWAFRMAHIPGSLNITTPEQAQAQLSAEDDIIVYCSNPDCIASKAAYRCFVDLGFQNVRRYAGGISDWLDAGYPLEGDQQT